MKTNWLDYTLLTLVIIGAINWGLIGFFRFDLVAFLFGNLSWLSRIVYALVVAFRAKCKIFSRHLQKPILKTEKGRFKGL